MIGLYLLIPTLITIFMSYLVVRAGAIALMMTGMDQQKARFQALSAFSRAGFTTREAEAVVNNPRRRQIITWLIILGNAGLVTVIVTATSSVATSEGYNIPITIGVIIVGALLLYLLAGRSRFARWWDSFIENRLVKSHVLEEGNTEDLLHLNEGYGLLRAIITQGSSLIGQSLNEANTTGDGFWIVGIERDRQWISLPRSVETINQGDKLVVYGNLNSLRNTFKIS